MAAAIAIPFAPIPRVRSINADQALSRASALQGVTNQSPGIKADALGSFRPFGAIGITGGAGILGGAGGQGGKLTLG
jgi:hypothetical protein